VAHGRHVALAGRSMAGAVDAACAIGSLRVPPGTRCELRRAMSLPPGKLVVVASGSQGEPASAMSRIAHGSHADVAIDRDDMAVISSRAVPGNEMSVARMLDRLARRGADVRTDRAPSSDGEGRLHVSGHASQDDLLEMLELVRPRTLVPVHGGYRHLVECAKLAGRCREAPESAVVAESGDIIEITRSHARVSGRAFAGRVSVDREGEPIGDSVLHDRRHLSRGGIVVPVLIFHRGTGALAAPPEIVSRGFEPLDTAEDRAGMQSLLSRVASDTIRAAGPGAARDRGAITARVAADLRRAIRNRTGRQPLVEPVVVEV
jgi:ribonuclease J